MLLKAGALSVALLLVSRLLGLLRESALAATFGTSGLADVAVLMLTLPDWLAGVLASGALAYVLLPAWVGRDAPLVAAIQRRVARMLLLCGAVLALLLAWLREPAAVLLAAGVGEANRGAAGQALVWSAFALPAALLAALWTTRLQHERDFLGMYSAGIVVNVVLLAGIGGAALGHAGGEALTWLGCGLLAAMGLRLAWLYWRQPAAGRSIAMDTEAALPLPPVWLWAVLSAGLPLILPFAARSMASHSGEGALATFSYAWKLIELPLVLVIQLVATIAFPRIAQALAAGGGRTTAADPANSVRTAFGLAFALGCACAAGLLAGAPALASLLFGWGRMQPHALEQVAQWARIGAWGLPPLAVISVSLTVLATRGRMKAAVLAYAVALAVLLAIGRTGVTDGATLMLTLNLLLSVVAAFTIVAMGRDAALLLPWRSLAASGFGLVVIALALRFASAEMSVANGLGVAALCSLLVLLVAWPSLRGNRIA